MWIAVALLINILNPTTSLWECGVKLLEDHSWPSSLALPYFYWIRVYYTSFFSINFELQLWVKTLKGREWCVIVILWLRNHRLSFFNHIILPSPGEAMSIFHIF